MYILGTRGRVCGFIGIRQGTTCNVSMKENTAGFGGGEICLVDTGIVLDV